MGLCPRRVVNFPMTAHSFTRHLSCEHRCKYVKSTLRHANSTNTLGQAGQMLDWKCDAKEVYVCVRAKKANVFIWSVRIVRFKRTVWEMRRGEWCKSTNHAVRYDRRLALVWENGWPKLEIIETGDTYRSDVTVGGGFSARNWPNLYVIVLKKKWRFYGGSCVAKVTKNPPHGWFSDIAKRFSLANQPDAPALIASWTPSKLSQTMLLYQVPIW